MEQEPVEQEPKEEKLKRSYEITLEEWNKEPRYWKHTPEQESSMAHYWHEYPENPISIRNDISNPDIIAHCLQHERGHLLDYEGLSRYDLNVRGGKLSKTDECLNLGAWEIQGMPWQVKRISNLCGVVNKILGGVTNSPEEEFAESYAQWVTHPEEFRSIWPERAHFLEEICSHKGIVKRALKSGELTRQQAVQIHKDVYPDIENWPEYIKHNK